jgi:hypothetical protein
VKNRVSKIREFGAENHFCEGTQNPADLLIRSVKEIQKSNWWKGPEWLPEYEKY